MISTLRNKKKLTAFALWVVIAAFVGTIFFVWGMGDKVSEANFAVSVDDSVISDGDFQQKLEITRENFRRLFGNNADEMLKNDTLEKTVLEQLINETLLKNEAARLNIPVSDAEVATYVQGIEAFKTDGVFDMQRYTDLLGRNRMTPQIFEAGVRSDITVQKMSDIIRKSVTVTDKEIQAEYVFRNTQAVVSYIELNADDALASVTYSPEDIKKFYNSNKEEYRVPEKADFKVLVFDPAGFRPQINVTDKEAEAYFIKNKETLKQVEQVKASHILIKVADWKNEQLVAEKYAQAGIILGEIKKGADFAEMAKKYSEDASGQNGGDLGFFSRGQMVVPFETAAFSLKPGGISDVVKTEYGFHIIMVTDKKEAVNPTLAEIKPQIIEAIKAERTAGAFRNEVYEQYKEIVNASNLTAFNQKKGGKLPIAEVKGITATGEGTPMAGMPDVLKSIMSLNKSEISQLIDVGERKFIFEMTEKYPSYIPKLENILPAVENDYKEHKSLEITKAQAAELAKLGSIKAAAEKTGKAVVTPTAFTRNEPIQGLGLNNDLMDSVFKAKQGAFIAKPYDLGRKVYAVQVVSTAKPSLDRLAEQKEQIASALLGVKTGEALKDYLAALKKNAKIVVSPRYEQFYKK